MPNRRLMTQDSELRTQDSELRTQNSGLRTQNSGLTTQVQCLLLRGRVQRVNAARAGNVLQLEPGAVPVDPGRDLFPLAGRVQLGMHDDVADVEARQFVEAGFVWEVPEQKVQPSWRARGCRCTRARSSAVPIECSMYIVWRRSKGPAWSDRAAGPRTREGRRTGGEPAIGEGDVDAMRDDGKGRRREFHHEQHGDSHREGPRPAWSETRDSRSKPARRRRRARERQAS